MEPEIQTKTYFLYEGNCPSLLTGRNQACIARSACVGGDSYEVPGISSNERKIETTSYCSLQVKFPSLMTDRNNNNNNNNNRTALGCSWKS